MLYAVFDWLDLVLSGFIGVILVYTLLSWTGAYSPTQQLFAQMVDPLLKPIRKITPLIGNIDFSPLILLLLIQMATVFLGQVQRQLYVRVLAYYFFKKPGIKRSAAECSTSSLDSRGVAAEPP